MQHEMDARELVAGLDAFLDSLGETGRYIRAHINDALAEGLEVPPEQHDGRRKTSGEARPVTYRPPRNDREILHIYVEVLEHYLVALPACLLSIGTRLEHTWGILSFGFAVPPEQLAEGEQRRDELLQPDHIFDLLAIENNRTLIDSLRRLVGMPAVVQPKIPWTWSQAQT